MKLLGGFLIALSLLLSISCTLDNSLGDTRQATELPQGTFQEARVLNVLTGDTIEVEMNGQRYTVRYLGIEAPGVETIIGKEALAKNTALVVGQTVKLEKDSVNVDSAGRLLRYVYLGTNFINAELARTGLAQVSNDATSARYYSDLLKAQQAAQQARLGIWISDLPTPPPPSTGPFPPDTTKVVPPPAN
jgi:micrococcal nuclease